MMRTDAALDRYDLLRPASFGTAVSFELRAPMDESGEGATLELVLRSADAADRRHLRLRFRSVRELAFTPTALPPTLSSVQITSVRERGWEGVNYSVSDEHGEQLRFLCESFEPSIENSWGR
jgi:hypothetical protein